MSKPNIICVDDQREVLAVIRRDLGTFSPAFNIVDCESASETEEVINDLERNNEQIAVIICDHIMPGENGIDFLIRLNKNKLIKNTKRILLTGLATHEDTIRAINEAQIDIYMDKPWESEKLVNTVKILLTKYFLASGKDYSEFMPYLDQEALES